MRRSTQKGAKYTSLTDLIDLVGHLRHLGLETVPVGVVYIQIPADVLVERIIHPKPGLIVRSVKGIAQIYIGHQSAAVCIGRIAAHHARGHCGEVCLVLPGHAPLVGQLMGDGGRQQRHGAVHVHVGLRGIGKEKAGVVQPAHEPGEHHRFGPEFRPGQRRERLLRRMIQRFGSLKQPVRIIGIDPVLSPFHPGGILVGPIGKPDGDLPKLLAGDGPPLQPGVLGEGAGIIVHAPPQGKEAEKRQRHGGHRHAPAIEPDAGTPAVKMDHKLSEKAEAQNDPQHDHPLRGGKWHKRINPPRQPVPGPDQQSAQPLHPGPVVPGREIDPQPQKRQENQAVPHRAQPPPGPNTDSLFCRLFHGDSRLLPG